MMNQKFQDYFQSVYKERWPEIFAALQVGVQHFQRPNSFYKPDSELLEFYKMDPASILVARALEVQPQEKVLDLCAAPGGKSLILAEALSTTGELISNEFSNSRRERLMRVFKEYIPVDQRGNIFVKGQDGNQFGLRMPDEFDRVLADVPCSGERHLLENKSEFEKWTVRRSQNLAVRQFSLLSSAWLACKPGGRVVYSTCSISPIENDDIIKKLIKRRSVQVLRPLFLDSESSLEKTEFGYQVLPDRSGFGPMYFSVMQKSI
jgi:16S rRNA C967 or C1407 C5-methylase (RsmB/RsmF family)